MSDELAKRGMRVFCRSFTRRIILKNARIIWIATPALAIFTGLAVLSPPLLAQNTIDWSVAAPQDMTTGTQRAFYCPPNPAKNNVRPTWGTDVYTSDSGICGSAVHAGLIGFDSGGAVTIQMTAGQQSYAGTTRNGVTSNGWGSWGQSFVFVGSQTGATAGGGSPNFLQNAFILGVQIGFVEMVTYASLDASYVVQQVLPTMSSYAAALGLPQDQLNAMSAQLRSGAASIDAYPSAEGVEAQFDRLLNRNCVCGNVYNLAKMYEAGEQIGWAEIVAYQAAHQDALPALLGVLTNARQAAALVGLPTNGLDTVIARVQAGASGCDVGPDIQTIEQQFEQLTNQPCTCMYEGNNPTNPRPGTDRDGDKDKDKDNDRKKDKDKDKDQEKHDKEKSGRKC